MERDEVGTERGALSGSRLAASIRVGPYPFENVSHAASASGSR